MSAAALLLFLAVTSQELVDEVYQLPAGEWRYVQVTLNRPPTDTELTKAIAYFGLPDNSRETATEVLLWALLNSAEFVFNH